MISKLSYLKWRNRMLKIDTFHKVQSGYRFTRITNANYLAHHRIQQPIPKLISCSWHQTQFFQRIFLSLPDEKENKLFIGLKLRPIRLILFQSLKANRKNLNLQIRNWLLDLMYKNTYIPKINISSKQFLFCATLVLGFLFCPPQHVKN